ncbi:family 76 glycosyl hydrolase [Emericellopsis atlantica]|uniref:Mannan endo-1,6-alpha-mannosidase n=1 Tax=Emericellopsis atlantica TaxID=2614577 RepID=A0A9P7ZNM6_9HYPO|nr:family 76 glycosyl hydrolase [Emericellopsis atlantica]KAG9255443.1 family 76 glycosyl hydrolase [Emericellopsis atlantica]
MKFSKLLAGLGLMATAANAIDVQIDDEQSRKEAAGTVAYGLLGFYYGNNTGDVPGNLPSPYYWWLCGAMMGTLIDYWHFTGDDSYNDLVKQAMIHQAGVDQDFLPANQTRAMGNDDQGFWAMTGMLAAEYKFPDPPEDGPQWLSIVQAVFNEFASRWDEEHCGGGLRWQVFDFNVGWNYKNSVSNGCFFNIASRLARYTGNDSYADWAETVWEWENEVGLMTDKYELKDGVTIRDGQDCREDMDPTQWSYNSGVWLHGAAIMSNYTDDAKWKTRVEGILNYGLDLFTKDGIIFEQQCETWNTCDDDQRSFKGYYMRWLAAVAQLIPELADKIVPLLKNTAVIAAGACSGSPTGPIAGYPPFKGHPGTACGFTWLNGSTFDNKFGVPESMNALAALLSTFEADPPVSADTGGTSKGNPGAGGSDEEKVRVFQPITTGDRAGAGILTTIIICGVIGGSAFLII